MNIKRDKTLLYFLFPTAILIIIGAGCGIFLKDIYALETENWKAQGIAQDLVDLFIIAPVLLVSGILFYQGRKIFTWIFGGTILFLIYTYTIYCFAVHFNFLFLVYCFTLGLSVYQFIYFVSRLSPTFPGSIGVKKVPAKLVSIFLILVAIIFYFLWLGEIIPAVVKRKTPISLIEAGLLTNPVQVLDISIVLPGFVIASILLLKRKRAGFLFAPVLLVFCVLMDISIAVLVILMKLRGIENSLFVAGLMGALALISSLLLYIFFRNSNISGK